MKLVIIIVTFNRLDKLIKTLSCYDQQTTVFDSIVVVDNCSTDGTKDYLINWKENAANYSKHIITMPYNSGGAGGFYAGQKFALTLKPDWVYVSDDDAYPALDMIERFYRICNSNDISNLSAICASVYKNDGNVDYEHRRTYAINKMGKFIQLNSSAKDYLKDSFPIHMLSYVGSFINVKALYKVGLCNPELFIYYDDTEHSIRLLKYGSIMCFPELKVLHDTGFNSVESDTIIYTWRNYYALRNYTYMLKRHFPISAIYLSFQYIYHIIKHRDVKTRLIFRSLFDAWFSKLGKHTIYKPGFVKEIK